MNRDIILFSVIGLLTGFIGGYFVHEMMVERQPPRLAQASTDPHSNEVAAPGPQGAPMAEITRLRERLASHPDDADALLELANMNYDIRSWDRARGLYERYIELRPAGPDVLTDLGVCLRGLGESRAALERFKEAQALAENHWQSLYNEVIVLALDFEDYEAADPSLARLVELQPNNEDVARLVEEVQRRRSGQA